jgi:hypothetical protein
MTNGSAPNGIEEGSNQARNIIIAGVIALVSFTIVLIVAAVLIAANAGTTAPHVEVVRDLLIIVLALIMLVIGAAITVLLIQIARFVNLLTNEVQPLIETTTDTVKTVRGTAQFISKHVTEPVIATAGALGGIAKVVGDVEVIRKAAGMAMQAAMSATMTGAQATTVSDSKPTDAEVQSADAETDHSSIQTDASNATSQSAASSIPDNF